jgi:hypothetical protein
VLFRRSSSDKGWGLKSLNLPIRGNKTSDIIGDVAQGLGAAGVLPYHVFYIEHCNDCEHHAMTTWHVPSSYEKRAGELRRSIRDYIPSSFVYSNKLRRPTDERCTTDGMARIGAFEITVRPYYSEYSLQVYSKLCRKVLPQASDVTDICSSLLLSDRLQYSKKRTVRVNLFDSYYKKLPKDVRVILFRVNTYHHTSDEPLESMAELREMHTHADTHAAVGTGTGHRQAAAAEEALEAAPPPPRSVLLSARAGTAGSGGSPTRRRSMQGQRSPARQGAGQGERKSSPAHEGRGLPPKKYAAGEEKKDSFTEELMRSQAIQDCVFRHSLSFYRVRCWSQVEVDQWLRSHGVPDVAIANAHVSGVEDGASLLALANKVTLRKWGVRGQLTLKKLDASLVSIRAGGEGYDPCILEGLPEDGQDRRGFSRAAPTCLSKKLYKYPSGRYFEQVSVINASPLDGSALFDISAAGSYVIVATSPSTATYCSHAFSCGAQSQYVYAALLKPITTPVYFRVIMEEADSRILDGVPFSTGGLLLSVVNMASGKRHTAYASFEEVFEESLGISEHDEEGEGGKMKPTMKAPKMQRFNSIVNILSAPAGEPLLPRSQSTGSIGGSKRGKKKTEHQKTHNRVTASVLWLPVGQYYSEVDGSVFSVVDKDHLAFLRDTPAGDLMGAVPELDLPPLNDRLIFGGEYTQISVVKCHKRLIKRSIRGFQMIYRRYKKTFLFDKMCAYMIMRRGARNFCNWAREEVMKKKIVKLQSWIRMAKVCRGYKAYWSSILFIQTRLRILLARLRLKKIKKSQRVIYTTIVRYHARKERRRFTAARAIQMAYRRKAAINKKDCLIFAKRCKKLFLRYINRIKAKVRIVNAAKLNRAREEGERQGMAGEERWVGLHALWQRAETRRLVEVRLEEIARRRYAAATRMQAFCRGPLLRQRLERGKWAVGKLQRIFRIGVYLKRRNRGEKLRYLLGFKMLLLHPQLLGGTLLLSGMTLSSMRPRPPLSPRGLSSGDEGPGPGPGRSNGRNSGPGTPTMKLDTNSPCASPSALPFSSIKSNKSSEHKSSPKKSESFGAYTGYLTRPAVKIQSVLRMTK